MLWTWVFGFHRTICRQMCPISGAFFENSIESQILEVHWLISRIPTLIQRTCICSNANAVLLGLRVICHIP